MKSKITILLLCTLFVGNLSAQSIKSGYFLEGNHHITQLNPAMEPERNFVSILGNLNIGVNGNVGLSNFLYPYENGQLTTFMSGTVDQNKFLKALPDKVKLGTDIDMTLLSFGFKAFGGYNSFNITLNSDIMVNVPKGLFEFAKKGFQENSYSFRDLRMHTMNYAAVTLGHSREVIPNLRVGLNLKYLMGLAYADAYLDKMDITMGEDKWLLRSHAVARVAAVAKAQLKTDEAGVVNGAEVAGVDFSSHGFAADLGATYDMSDIVKGLSFSASVVDLGFIHWGNTLKASTKDETLEFAGFDEIDVKGDNTAIENQMQQLQDDAKEMVKLYDDGVEKHSSMLAATMHLGAQYKMPFYDRLSVGLLFSQRFGKATNWSDGRLFLNISPLNWLEASANFSYSTFGAGFGWMLNIHPVGFSIFLGSDFMITKVNPQFIPVNNLKGNFSLGISFPFGKRK